MRRSSDRLSCHLNHIGYVLKKLEDISQLDNTIVVFTTDNGAESITFPDGGITPFRGQKGEAWEGGYRAPLVVRWPGHIKPGTVKNQMFAALDWLPTLVGIAGGPKGDGLKKQIEAASILISSRPRSTALISATTWRESRKNQRATTSSTTTGGPVDKKWFEPRQGFTPRY
jgi:arylsulfatase A-like enzyme